MGVVTLRWGFVMLAQSVVKIMIVDDHPAVREALALRISKNPPLAICAEAEDAEQAIRLVEETRPDLVITDITLKGLDGIELVRRLRARDDKLRILVWSMHSDQTHAEQALRAGAQGYINKRQATGKIIDAIRDVMAGKVYVCA